MSAGEGVRRRYQDCGVVYRAWCRVACRLFHAIPSRWVFTKPAMWLLQYAGHYAYSDDTQAARKAMEAGSA